MTAMLTEHAEKILKEKYSDFQNVTVDDAIEQPVDAAEFYRAVGDITEIWAVGSYTVSVKFDEPFPGETELENGYTYTVSVAEAGHLSQDVARCGMPREHLITLHQVAIVVWAIVMGKL